MNAIFSNLEKRYPALNPVIPSLRQAVDLVIRTQSAGGTLFTCGNGGSGADADHIAGEMLKGFLSRRPMDAEERSALLACCGEKDGTYLADSLQKGLRCISLLSHPGFLSAFANDVDPVLVYAQQLYALGKKGDVILGITCSGNAGNVRSAFQVARHLGISSILLTGAKAGKCVEWADCVIAVPETEVFQIQELHLPVYHALCAAVEKHFYGSCN
ncbi:MAG: SIS domain-containing protein [Lentisphaeria bacterium]|nr:SIS domain-containing protein [Lentisphaeria bacterium]